MKAGQTQWFGSYIVPVGEDNMEVGTCVAEQEVRSHKEEGEKLEGKMDDGVDREHV